MNQKIVVANLKTYITSHNAHEEYLSQLRESSAVLSSVDHASFVVCPSALYLAESVRTCSDLSVSWGVQDIQWDDSGKHTGSTSAAAVGDMDVRYAIIGHSERRALGEGQETVVRKVQGALAESVTPIVCVGYIGDYADEISAVIDQVVSVIGSCNKEDVPQVIFAYEPVWAIGSGQTPTPEQIKTMRTCIHRTIEKVMGISIALRVLYGGSVTHENAVEICTAGAADGVLVGGASRDPAELVKIYELLNK